MENMIQYYVQVFYNSILLGALAVWVKLPFSYIGLTPALLSCYANMKGNAVSFVDRIQGSGINNHTSRGWLLTYIVISTRFSSLLVFLSLCSHFRMYKIFSYHSMRNLLHSLLFKQTFTLGCILIPTYLQSVFKSDIMLVCLNNTIFICIFSAIRGQTETKTYIFVLYF